MTLRPGVDGEEEERGRKGAGGKRVLLSPQHASARHRGRTLCVDLDLGPWSRGSAHDANFCKRPVLRGSLVGGNACACAGLARKSCPSAPKDVWTQCSPHETWLGELRDPCHEASHSSPGTTRYPLPVIGPGGRGARIGVQCLELSGSICRVSPHAQTLGQFCNRS